MIVSKTPFRISFFGGGSDLPSYYNQSPGMVVSATIDKYLYISLNKKFDDSIRVSYSTTENVNNVDELNHDIVRHTLKYFDVTRGIELASISDLPSNGTGMGASSAFAVGLIKALENYKFSNDYLHKSSLAELACQIEIYLCQKPIGKQDQYACAYGGFNTHSFYASGVESKKILLDDDVKVFMEQNLILLHTSKGRSADDILKNQSKRMVDNEKSFQNIQCMVDLAKQFETDLKNKDLKYFGEMLDYSWQLKKEVSDDISNLEIDEMYEDAKNCGATGGKILGAGGGGFMLLFADTKAQQKIKEQFSKNRPFNFKFDFDGSTVFRV
jgi:D-glycero-alpha-D-manno-heptose-7-phosphate kinase